MSGLDIVQPQDVIKEDKRNSIRRYLQTDSVCSICGAIVNSFYEDRCLVCDCGGTSFISGKTGVNLRVLLDFHLEELRGLCEIHGVRYGGRAQMVIRVLRKIDRVGKVDDNRIDEMLIRKIIIRNRKRFWFVKDIDDAVSRVRKCNIRLVDEKDMMSKDMMSKDMMSKD